MKLGAVIAKREYSLSDNDGTEIVVLLGTPKPFPDSVDFYCPYQIKGYGENKIKYAGGVDEIQSIQLAIQKIRVELNYIEDAKKGKLMWLGGDGDGLN